MCIHGKCLSNSCCVKSNATDLSEFIDRGLQGSSKQLII